MTIARQPQGIPVGGQFAATSHSEAGITLAPESTAKTVPLAGSVQLDSQWFEKLPEWPEDMPEPEVSFGFDDGKAETYVVVDGQMMTFWNSDQDGTICNTAHGQSPWDDFDLEDQEKAEAWGKAVHERVDSATYGVMMEACNAPAVRDLILAQATDTPEPAPVDLSDENTRNAYLVEAERQVADARRELQQVYMIGAAQELREEFPEIDSFELAIGGKHLEISAAYDSDGNPVPNDVVGAASSTVFRYRSEDDFNTYLDGQVVTVEDAISFRPGA